MTLLMRFHLRSLGFRLLAVAASLGLLGGCVSTIDLSGLSTEAEPVNCETVTADATASTERSARAIAEKALRNEIGDAKGDLVSSGLKRARIKARETRCRPYSLTSTLVQCRAAARVCGRG